MATNSNNSHIVHGYRQQLSTGLAYISRFQRRLHTGDRALNPEHVRLSGESVSRLAEDGQRLILTQATLTKKVLAYKGVTRSATTLRVGDVELLIRGREARGLGHGFHLAFVGVVGYI